MPDNDLWYCGPWTLWVMAGRGVASGAGVWRGDRVATPLAVAITAAGLVSGARIGPGAAAKRDPQLAQWNEIRSHYQEIAEWIDHDTATAHPAVAATQISAAGSFGRANMVDYLGLNRPGMSGDSSSWKGWGHVRWFIEEVPAGA
ncbi:hypothetical protein T572_00503, partial [Mycobacterium tuberculosis UT0034]